MSIDYEVLSEADWNTFPVNGAQPQTSPFAESVERAESGSARDLAAATPAWTSTCGNRSAEMSMERSFELCEEAETLMLEVLAMTDPGGQRDRHLDTARWEDLLDHVASLHARRVATRRRLLHARAVTPRG
jgi:hypothetical protein